MATGSSLVKAALRKLNYLQSGDDPTTDERTDFIGTLNGLIDHFNAQRVMIWSIPRQTFTLTASLNPHTIGSGADINVARPSKISAASIVDSDQEYPLTLIDRSEYQAIPDKDAETTIPSVLWYDPAFPNGNIYLFPVPSSANTLALYIWTVLSTAITWAGTINLPPAYERMLIYNLAMELSTELGAKVTDELRRGAIASLDAVKILNMPTEYMMPDPRIFPPGRAGGGHYNIFTNYS